MREKVMKEYVVNYGYFNYPLKERVFPTYEQAKKFFYALRDPRIKRKELWTRGANGTEVDY
jgi:hypothetical protein